MKITRPKLYEFLSENGFIIIFIVWCLFLAIYTPPFRTMSNLMTVLRQASIIGIVAIGECLIVLMGSGMDISLAATLGLSGVIVATAIAGGFPIFTAVLAGIVLGGMVGLFNGVLVTRVRINGLVVTLGMMYALEGLGFVLTKGQTISSDGILTLAPLSRGYLGPVPVPVLLLFAAYGIAHYILNYTVFGAHTYALGNNERASWLSGINIDRLRLFSYMIAGLLAGFGGLMQTARMGSATAGMGSEFLFPILTAVILAGVSLSGGKGRILNVLIGAIFLATIANGLILLNVPIYIQKIVSGCILVAALSLDRLRNIRG